MVVGVEVRRVVELQVERVVLGVLDHGVGSGGQSAEMASEPEPRHAGRECRAGTVRQEVLPSFRFSQSDLAVVLAVQLSSLSQNGYSFLERHFDLLFLLCTSVDYSNLS